MDTIMKGFCKASCTIFLCFNFIACFGLIPDCPTEPPVALYEVAFSCIKDTLHEPAFDTQLTLLSMTNVSYWNKYCRSWRNTKPCVLKTFNNCPPEYVATVLNWAVSRGMGYQNGFSPGGINDVRTYQKMCNRAYLKYSIVDEMRLPGFKKCLHHLFSRKVLNCYVKMTDEFTFLGNLGFNATVSPESTKHIYRWEKSAYQCILSELKGQCNDSTINLLFRLVNITIPNLVQLPATDTTQDVSENLITYEHPRQTRGTFINGNMLIDQPGIIQMCTEEGNILYMKNKYYKLVGNTVAVPVQQSFLPDTKAYLMNQVSIEFFDEGFGRLGTYLTKSGEISTIFVNGVDSLTDNSSSTIYINLNPSNNSITIVHERSASVFIVYRWQQYYGVLLRTTDEILRNSYGQLRSGCSLSKLYTDLDYLSVNACTIHCMESQVPALSQQLISACLYNCAVLGEQAFNLTNSMTEDLTVIKDMDQHIFDLRRTAGKTSSVAVRITTSYTAYLWLVSSVISLLAVLR